MRKRILHGDCLKRLRALPSNSIDSLITDPPAGIGFMSGGRKDHWDSDKGGRDSWIAWLAEILREVHRVLKPGAYGLVWALPRTSHWTAMAIETAGFTVRDCVYHHFSTGFPKSHNVSKAIDKAADAERSVIGKRTDGARNSGKEFFIGGKNFVGTTTFAATAPATAAAKQWDGFGTALKPSTEIWWLIQKPVERGLTIAENVMKHGVGCLNIDGTRIATDELKGKVYRNKGDALTWGGTYGKGPVEGHASGRWPSHLLLSCAPACGKRGHAPSCPVAELDRQSGVSKSPTKVTRGTASGWGPCRQGDGTPFEVPQGYGDSGGASRFFYCAKPSRSERNRGCEGLLARSASTRNAFKGLPDLRMKQEQNRLPAGNTHPTIKPIRLMRYLIRLITPPGGTCLDPFLGSGTTGCAAVKEGMRFIGIERERDYVKIARARIRAAERAEAAAGVA